MHLSLVGEDGRVLAWPDGGPLLQQPVQLTQAFDRITTELNRWRRSQEGK